ncbi:Cof-type HAD-IIB family hydrolase [Erysipelothrix sp. HDW6C]|uniref:Cof-type HAD-IIB family hydrolase n=1 Tax=Erysipelothrix sp. HDW6C TaxID=2714930 RepID=UPI001409468D|nr:Cof-type HAD-IIB family hydrolase [Erysipelothrix sp. HDW6C]QIK70758.1 Cof-type HAD-IIB family hydrolase [Erysipelothrix sp. HDW6C]
MEKQCIFLDVDGTLCAQDGSVPASAVQAIQQAKEQGHTIFLCTGRSKPEITDALLNLNLDGIIGAGGAYIEVDGVVLLHQTMDETKVRVLETYFKEHNIGYYLETNDGLFASDNCVASLEVAIDSFFNQHPDLERPLGGANWFYEILSENDGKPIDYSAINKISFISATHPYQAVVDAFGDDFEMHHSTVAMFGPNSGEVAVKGITKYTAVNQVLNYLGFKQSQSMAYGDGGNDVDMFRAVNYGVAMANAKQVLLDIADEVTAIAEEDGILQSFKRNGLIGE